MPEKMDVPVPNQLTTDVVVKSDLPPEMFDSRTSCSFPKLKAEDD